MRHRNPHGQKRYHSRTTFYFFICACQIVRARHGLTAVISRAVSYLGGYIHLPRYLLYEKELELAAQLKKDSSRRGWAYTLQNLCLSTHGLTGNRSFSACPDTFFLSFTSSDHSCSNGFLIFLNCHGLGQCPVLRITLPSMSAIGSGPYTLESRDAYRLSPSTQQCPLGT